MPQSGNGGLHAGNIAVVVCAPQVDQLGVAALVFEHVVGNVRRQVGVGAVLLFQHAVFVVAKLRGAQPNRAVLFIHQALFLKHGQHFVHTALVHNPLFAHPAVEIAAEFVQVLLNFGKLNVVALHFEERNGLLFGGVQPFVAHLVLNLLRNVDDVRSGSRPRARGNPSCRTARNSGHIRFGRTPTSGGRRR